MKGDPQGQKVLQIFQRMPQKDLLGHMRASTSRVIKEKMKKIKFLESISHEIWIYT